MSSSDSVGVPVGEHDAGTSVSAVTVRCWGTRGSIPAPGQQTVRYGGNTSCVEIRAGRESVILDAGTGIRPLGKEIAGRGEADGVQIYLTHYHWDHIQGLPFFAPAYIPGFRVHVLGPDQGGKGVGDILRGQMRPPYFPVTLDELPASFTFSRVEEGAWTQGDFFLRAMRVRHPSHTLGYRVEALGRSVVYVPDNELEGGSYDLPDGWRKEFEEFVRGADILFHDAMFTESERSASVGWGHSTFEQAVELALGGEVKSLFFFHHASGRPDEEIGLKLESLREELARQGSALEVRAAEEGMDIVL